jgi:hypothetical protein
MAPRTGSPLWLWPNLLSLDAPLVAVLWQVLFARCFRASAETLPAVLLVLAVWLIYVADRALDAWRGMGRTPRHEFYRRHWRMVLPVWLAALAAGAWLAAIRLSPALFRDGLALLAAVVLYFGVVHLVPENIRGAWPKEAVVGLLFALGASLEAWTKIRTAADVITVLLFSCLCWINCAAIEKWESCRGIEWPVGAAAVCVGAAAFLLLYEHRPVLGGAEMASALAFLLLDRGRRRFSADALRVLADAALLSPVLFLPIAGLG